MQFPVNFRQQGKYGKMPQAEYGAGPMRGKAGGNVFQGNVSVLSMLQSFLSLIFEVAMRRRYSSTSA